MTVSNTPAAPAIRVRAADAGDAPLIAELGARTFRDTYAAQNRPEDLDAYIAEAYGPQRQAAELADPNHRHLVAERDGEVIGFALLRDDVREPGVPGKRPTMLLQLYVERPFQGQGVGAALMQACLDLAVTAGHDVLGVGVWEHNPRAIAFYERWGFEQVGETSFTLGTQQQRDLVLARWL